MVEGTLALSIPGLFLTCVQYFTLIQLGQNFKHDFASCHLELRWIELRIQRWGKAAGITDQSPEDFKNKFEGKHDENEVTLICDTLKQIQKQFQRAQEDSEEIIKKKKRTDPETKELELINELEQLQLCEKKDAKVGRTHRFVKKIKSGYASSRHVAAQSQWALYKKTQLEHLVKMLREHVFELESVFPDQEKILVAAEAKEMDKGVMEVLAPHAKESDPLLAKAMEGEAPKRGFSYSDIKVSGYSTTQFGSIYRRKPKDEGYVEYKGIDSRGRSDAHFGNIYGYESLHASRSARGGAGREEEEQEEEDDDDDDDDDEEHR